MKVPTKHGLDRKFKPWRKGKSAKSNKRSSLKQQLRGHERLLAKLGQGGGNSNNDASVDDDAQKRKELEAKIDILRQEIGAKQQQIQCKKHAEKAHGPRFMDRQKLTRLEKQVRKKKKNDDDDDDTNTNNEDTKEPLLFKLALDQVYVAHHPTDIKYMPLFKHGQRITDQSRQLYRRAVTRKRILKGLSSANTTSTNDAKDPNAQRITSRVAWISQDQYDRLPTDWTIQDEERVFGGSISRKNINDAEKDPASTVKAQDDRFAMTPTAHEAIIQAADDLEAEIDQEEQKVGDNVGVDQGVGQDDPDCDGTSSSSSDDEPSGDEIDGQDADPLVRQQPNKASKTQTSDDNKDDSGSASDSSDSGSDSDSNSDNHVDDDRADKTQPSKTTSQNEKLPTLGSDGGDDDDDDDDNDNEVDDFLMDTADNEDNDNVFEKTTSEIPAWGEVRGDKSRGWETQRQRPGEFKRKRVRY